MPRYVILTHDHPFPHWDLLLECGDACRTWRLLAEPHAGTRIEAEPLPDHRLLYLDYTGPVSGGRGRVARWDAGGYTIRETARGLQIELDGVRGLIGAVMINESKQTWWEFASTAVPHEEIPSSSLSPDTSRRPQVDQRER